MTHVKHNVLRVYSLEVDYDVKLVGIVSSDFGWNVNKPGTSRSKASYMEVLVVFSTA
jgi:hypothetical protein